MAVIVKRPFLASTSGWQPNVTWRNSSIPLSGGLCRASLGLWLQDEVFPDYWQQWKEMGIPRCAYHFYKIGYSSADQAEFFVGCLYDAGGWKAGDKLSLDVEESHGDDMSDLSIGGVLDFYYHVKLLTGLDYDQFLTYSRANIMNPLSLKKLSAEQKNILLRIKTWPAGYINDPNPYGFDDLKKFYHFDTDKYGQCVVVQYAASVEIEGINPIEGRSTECNVADPDYLAQWQEETGTEIPPEPPPEPPTGDTMNFKVTVNATASGEPNIRETGGATLGRDIGNFHKGQVGLGTEVLGSPTGQYYCLHVTSGADVEGWIYSRWNNAPTYATIEEIATPPTVTLPTIHLSANGYPDYDWKPV